MKLENISLSFGEKKVFDNWSAEIPAGAHVQIVGPSGSGKTTLLKVIARLQKRDGGKITGRGRMAFHFQEPRLLPWKTVLQNLLFVGIEKEKAHKTLALLGLEGEADSLPQTLSGGMKQRVSLARTLCYAEKCDTLLLDEPFTGLDEENKQKVISLLQEVGADKTVLLVSHDTDLYPDKIKTEG